MTREERKLALYCLKASSDYHSEVCENCIKYPKCDHMEQDDVTETIIKALEQEAVLDKIFCIVYPLSIMSTSELEHKAIIQIAEMLEPLCLLESEDKR